MKRLFSILFFLASVSYGQSYVGGIPFTLTSGYTFAGTLTGNTAVTFPTSGTLLTSTVSSLTSLTTVGSTLTVGSITYPGTLTAGDLPYASASNTLSKLAAGTSGQVLGLASGIPAWTTVITNYATTIASADNTASETDVISITVPANTWADGETITFEFVTQTKNNNGPQNLTPRYYWGANSVALTATSVAASATQGQIFRFIKFSRIGSDIWITSFGLFNTIPGSTTTDAYAAGSGGQILTQTFTADTVLKLSLQWAAANSATYYRIKSARAFKL